MEFAKYEQIDSKLFEDQNYFLEIKRQDKSKKLNNLSHQYADMENSNFESTLFIYFKDPTGSREILSDFDAFGWGHNISDSLERANNMDKYYVPLSGVGGNKKRGFTSLEKFLLKNNFSVRAKQEGNNQIFTFISYLSGEENRPDGRYIAGILKPTFSEGIQILNQIEFNQEIFSKMIYADKIKAKITELKDL